MNKIWVPLQNSERKKYAANSIDGASYLEDIDKNLMIANVKYGSMVSKRKGRVINAFRTQTAEQLAESFLDYPINPLMFDSRVHDSQALIAKLPLELQIKCSEKLSVK